MRIETFEMERMQSTWENIVDYDLSESGVRPLTLRELAAMGFDLEAFLDEPLGYSQSNGTIELRERIAAIYPGAGVDGIEVTNGTSEANYLIALSQIQAGDVVAMQVPNYMQMPGVARSLGFSYVRIGEIGPDSGDTEVWAYESQTLSGVQLSHTVLYMKADQDGKYYQVAMDNVYATDYVKNSTSMPASLAALKAGTRIEVCGEKYSDGSGIHWVHNNCGDTPSTSAPNGWTKTIASSGSVSANLERSTNYCYLWN